MICPTCKEDMIVLEYNEIELDYCANCRGVWFDSGELELLLESIGLDSPKPLLDEIFSSPEANSSEKKRRCPIHGRKMKKVAIGEGIEIVVDICQQGDGLWFDGGEVVHLIRFLGGKPPKKPGSQQEVIDFLGEVFKSEE
jgi:Zn-finger nucleic acid-binding protein